MRRQPVLSGDEKTVHRRRNTVPQKEFRSFRLGGISAMMNMNNKKTKQILFGVIAVVLVLVMVVPMVLSMVI